MSSFTRLILGIRDLPPMPRNRSHQIVNKMLIKTKLCREFEKDLTQRLKETQGKLDDFRNSHTNQHYITATYYIFTPRESLFTQDGRISLRATDTDAHKVFRDVLYKSIGLDDKLERDTRFFTPISDDGKWNYVMDLKLEKISCLTNTPSLTLSLEESVNLL